MLSLVNVESQIKNLYDDYLKTNNIDPKTGFLDSTDKKLATYPFIGSKYGQKRRILFIGMDIGSDERNGITSIEQRRKDIEYKDLSKHNPHIAGTYMLSLFFLRNENEYCDIWKEVCKMDKTCQMILKNEKAKLGLDNVENCLSYAALTNYYKYVTKNREKRAGGLDRKYLNKKDEVMLLNKEIEILNPEVIFIQSQSFLNIPIEYKTTTKLILGNHPSSREEGTRIPKNMIKTAVQIIREIS